jgi:hypothetical protein
MDQIDPTLLQNSRDLLERSRELRAQTRIVLAALCEVLSDSYDIVSRCKQAREERERRPGNSLENLTYINKFDLHQ